MWEWGDEAPQAKEKGEEGMEDSQEGTCMICVERDLLC